MNNGNLSPAHAKAARENGKLGGRPKTLHNDVTTLRALLKMAIRCIHRNRVEMPKEIQRWMDLQPEARRQKFVPDGCTDVSVEDLDELSKII